MKWLFSKKRNQKRVNFKIEIYFKSIKFFIFILFAFVIAYFVWWNRWAYFWTFFIFLIKIWIIIWAWRNWSFYLFIWVFYIVVRVFYIVVWVLIVRFIFTWVFAIKVFFILGVFNFRIIWWSFLQLWVAWSLLLYLGIKRVFFI